MKFMRLFGAIIVTVLTILLVVLLDNPVGPLPALGRVLDPLDGWAAVAEADEESDRQFALPGLKAPAKVWMEARMVPHISASSNHDLYYVQGYVHAYFRLWQMDFQTMAAAGRLGEVVGEKMQTDAKTGKQVNAILTYDRTQRRKGMIYAAENSLKAMESDPRTKETLDAYTAGVNDYIAQMDERKLPIEYKLMGYRPGEWTNLRTALLLKFMADDLTGYTEDIELTMLRDLLSPEQFALLYPERLPGETPVIPPGTHFESGSMPNIPVPEADTLWAHFGNVPTAVKQEASEGPGGAGSNSWAVSGAHTKSGAPILCNDPHLRLSMPALWFEMQLQAPDLNVYGVSIPGAPGIVIGFNDSISWGMTNNYRDVKDFYEIEAVDQDFYLLDGKPLQFSKRVEEIGIRGKASYFDTIDYTIHGPVMYDERFPTFPGMNKKLALTWMAHRETNELLSLYLLNRAQDYIAFTEAITHFECPAQNIVYADRSGNIAMWGQGQFINKWKDQGRFVMKGNTSATLWGANIPMTENPQALNPEQGFLSSANQITTDSTYPYWYNGYFSQFRAWSINNYFRRLPERNLKVTLREGDGSYVLSMPHMQNDVRSILAEQLLPILVANMPETEARQRLSNWNGRLDADRYEPALFQVTWHRLYHNIWDDELAKIPMPLYPSEERTMQLVLLNGLASFVDDKRTERPEDLKDLVQRSYVEALDSLRKLAAGNAKPTWAQVRNTKLMHLARLPAFSSGLIKNGGWGHTINAMKATHGPSWRMMVEMGRDSIIAYGVYPGGQSGNPGSKYYDNFVNTWAKGNYFRLYLLPKANTQPQDVIKYTWTIQKEI